MNNSSSQKQKRSEINYGEKEKRVFNDLFFH